MRRSVLGGLGVVLALTLTSCGDDGADPDAGTSASASPSASSAEETPAPATEEPTTPAAPESGGDTYAAATPAAGPTIATATSTISAPAGWSEPLTDSTGGASGLVDDPRFSVQLADVEDPVERPVDELAALAERSSGLTPDQRLPDVVLAGIDAYHYRGIDPVFDIPVDQFGLAAHGRKIIIKITTPKRLPDAERDQLVGEIAASFRLL